MQPGSLIGKMVLGVTYCQSTPTAAETADNLRTANERSNQANSHKQLVALGV